MKHKFIASTILASGLAMTAFAAQAQGDFATLSKAPAAIALTADQMAKVEGKAHIYLLVEHRGVELPATAEAATRVAAPTPKGGDFARTPSRYATAFDFLPPPPPR